MINAAPTASAPSAFTLIPQIVTCNLDRCDMAQLSIENLKSNELKESNEIKGISVSGLICSGASIPSLPYSHDWGKAGSNCSQADFGD